MSLSALPEWKQLLLERKRREEEERERREREEEQRLASMPAWKRGIIQRRRAKQDEEREREKERDGGPHTPDILSIDEDINTEQTDSKLTHHLQTEQTGYKLQKQISKDTISPIQQNPFIRSENSFRRDNRGKEVIRDGENEYKKAANNRGRERNRETEKEIWKGQDREMWVEKMGSKNEGRERDRSTGREIREADGSTSLFPPVVGLRTIQAHNIIIIEKDKNDKENPDKREKEVREDQKMMRMDLREFLASGGSVTEIRASEVLIIKPPVMDGIRETETERGSERLGKEGIWSSMQLLSRTVMQRAERVLNHKDMGAPECSGRVSQLLSKFGEHPKPPMRSKSTECFKNRARYSTGDLFLEEEQSTEETETSLMLRGVPKRSFSFSDRVVCQQENRDCEQKTDFKVVERSYSDRRVKTKVTDQSGSEPKVARRWGRPKHDEVRHEKRQKEIKVENKRNKSVCGETEEWTSSVDGGEDFTLASVKIPEGFAFARRVPIKQDGMENSSKIEIKKMREENEREIMIDKEIYRDKRREERETLIRQRPTEFQTEAKTESERRWNQEEETVVVSKQSCGIYIPPSDDRTIDFPTDSRCRCDNTPSADSSCLTMVDYVGQRQPSGQAALTQHTEDLLSKIGKVKLDGELKRTGYIFSHGDTERISGEMSNQDQKEHQQYQSIPKQASEELHFTSQQTVTLGQRKLCTQEGVTIPRTVFYGVNISERRRASLPAGDTLDGGQVERRGSWKAGRPLTRVESLKERIRQQQKERQNDDKEEGSREAGGTVREQEETTLQTLRLFDVTQDVNMAKSNPQLPVPVSLSLLQSASTEREVGEIARDASESDICPREAERDTQRHVEECGTCIAWRTQDIDEREREEEYLPPSLSPSPPLSDSLDAMSRIYNLKTVGSRTAVCISERTADMPPHSGHQGKYNPIRQAPSPDILPETAKLWNHGRDGDKTQAMESTGVQMVQRQVERLQLREQEAGCGSHNDKKAQPTMESWPLVEPEIRATEGQKKPDILRETQKSQIPTSPRFPEGQRNVQRQSPIPQQVRSFTINARSTESTENSQKPPEQSPPSPTSPCTTSPSSSPSPPLFSIRSASGRPGKRGTTITITPRRPAGAASSGAIPTGTPATPKAVTQGHIPTPAPSSTKEAGKKRYPTAKEIEVIGGYQNLERSCLVKSRGTPKAVKVCFDDAQLERVCEYPSEGCALASLPHSPHPGPGPGPEDGGMDEGEQEAEAQEEDEEEESAAFVSHRGMSECAARARFIKVGQWLLNYIIKI
ncbi:uncharacterized protein [Sinocyclocheilus grahami]|uniref:Uncharacterized LOC107562446 n=1 Tax=Sinocyclocheilus grahami TaxID=75366 RepID=A0A672L687_SINGR|nr:PREDICTED: uncharacterized protein LOC107562446 isoform X1 [Sinocyclocheilus grahami]XP_016102564.1 PREDICTED: uncharacterized protein LOC107562446 isoform X1 [Sinocyclocheilus grahami]